MTKLDEAVSALNEGGKWLWDGISEQFDLDTAQKAQLLEACRAKDRCDQLDGLLRGHISAWTEIQINGAYIELVINSALDKSNACATNMKQLIAAMRLPDDNSGGKRPQFRGSRGATAPRTPPGGTKPMSALEKARQARSA